MKPEQQASFSAMNELIDRPTIAQLMPEDLEATAKKNFQDSTEAVTGHRWNWEEAGEGVQNCWRVRAFIEAWSRKGF